MKIKLILLIKISLISWISNTNILPWVFSVLQLIYFYFRLGRVLACLEDLHWSLTAPKIQAWNDLSLRSMKLLWHPHGYPWSAWLWSWSISGSFLFPVRFTARSTSGLLASFPRSWSRPPWSPGRTRTVGAPPSPPPHISVILTAGVRLRVGILPSASTSRFSTNFACCGLLAGVLAGTPDTK